MTSARAQSLVALVLATTALCVYWGIHRQNLRLKAEVERLQFELAQNPIKDTETIPTSPDPEEHLELLRLRSELQLLRSSMPAMSGQKEATQGAVPRPTEQLVRGAEEPTPPIRSLLPPNPTIMVSKEMLRDAGADSWTNIVETAIWASLHGNLSRFNELWSQNAPSESPEQTEAKRRGDLEQLAKHLETVDSVVFVEARFLKAKHSWQVLTALNPGPTARPLSFFLRNEGGSWRISGFDAGPVLRPSDMEPETK